MSVLPNLLPPQSTPLCIPNANGSLIIDQTWYLFLYHLWTVTLSAGTGAVLFPDATNIPMVDSDVVDSDALAARQQALNILAMLTEPEIPVRLTDPLVLDALLPDPSTRAAQPSAVITPGASPSTYTALANGCLAVSGGTVTAIHLIRQGVNTNLGLTSGMFPLSRLDQLVITYTGVPQVVFFPT